MISPYSNIGIEYQLRNVYFRNQYQVKRRLVSKFDIENGLIPILQQPCPVKFKMVLGFSQTSQFPLLELNKFKN